MLDLNQKISMYFDRRICYFNPVDDRYKWVDDLSLMEIINLLSIGLTAFNFYNQVASDIGVDDQY